VFATRCSVALRHWRVRCARQGPQTRAQCAVGHGRWRSRYTHPTHPASAAV